MDYEKKYKEILEVVKQLRDSNPSDEGIQNWVSDNFPELEEIANERIRKALLKMVRNTPDVECEIIYSVSKEEAIAWLEKQGGQNPKEQVEPKFKAGDWIVNDGNPNCINSLMQIIGIRGTEYLCLFQNSQMGYSFQHIDETFHLWTIEDAKSGDVLASKDGDDILIFRDVENSVSFSSYYNIARRGNYFWLKSNFIPATKEQRDLLFQNIKEAGYEWDGEHKVLNKTN